MQVLEYVVGMIALEFVIVLVWTIFFEDRFLCGFLCDSLSSYNDKQIVWHSRQRSSSTNFNINAVYKMHSHQFNALNNIGISEVNGRHLWSSS